MEKSGDYFRKKTLVPFGPSTDLSQPWRCPAAGGYITPWQIAICRKIFGEDFFLLAARTLNVLFFIFALSFIFRLTVLLTHSSKQGLLSVFIAAILPLGIFFSRNLQPESPSFFLMVVSLFYGLRIARGKSMAKDWILFAMAACALCFAKWTFFVFLSPIFFTLCRPGIFHLKLGSALAQKMAVAVLFLVAFFIFIMVEAKSGAWWAHRINVLRFFSPIYWHDFGGIIYHYAVRENFTMFYLVTAGLGSFLILLKGDAFLRRFISGWIAGLIVYGILLADLINQHNYYQMPFLFLIAFCSAYFLTGVGKWINHWTQRHTGWLIVGGLLICSAPSVYAATMSQYNYILFGQDVAGEYLKKHVPVNKPFFHHTWAQGYGVCVYADRVCGEASDAEDFKRKELEYGMNYVSIFPAAYFQNLPKDLREYISSHYHVVHMGFTPDREKGLIPWDLVLKNGGAVDVDGFLKGKKLRLAKVYDMAQGDVPYLVAEE